MDFFTQLVFREIVIVILGMVCIGLLYRNYSRGKEELILATENTEAESRIRFLLGVINNAADGLIAINESGLIQLFNPACERMFGYTAQEMIGRKVNVLMPDAHGAAHDNYIGKYLKTHEAKIIGLSREVVGKRKNGETFPLDIAINEIMLPGRQRMFVGILRDITARRMAEKEHQEAMLQMQQILTYISYTSEGIYGIDLQGHTIFANKAAEEMLGFTLEEMMHKSQHDLIHHHYPDGSAYPKEQCNIYHAFRDGKTHTESNEVFWRKNGFNFPVEYTSSPTRDDKGAITGAVVVFRDVTERKLAEKETAGIRGAGRDYQCRAEPGQETGRAGDEAQIGISGQHEP